MFIFYFTFLICLVEFFLHRFLWETLCITINRWMILVALRAYPSLPSCVRVRLIKNAEAHYNPVLNKHKHFTYMNAHLTIRLERSFVPSMSSNEKKNILLMFVLNCRVNEFIEMFIWTFMVKLWEGFRFPFTVFLNTKTTWFSRLIQQTGK